MDRYTKERWKERFLTVLGIVIAVVAIIMILQGCGEDTHTTIYQAPIEEDGKPATEFIVDDENISDVTDMLNIQSITATDDGIIAVCTMGSVCSFTTTTYTYTDSYNTDNTDNSVVTTP